ncbi:hypothetical protein [Streptomyces sp. NPDC057438]|uniref:hypothetical protein n=1 Tax=Streptomyces sp. NPDC057438 TaxID=3346133 RepID=UPI003683D462
MTEPVWNSVDAAGHTVVTLERNDLHHHLTLLQVNDDFAAITEVAPGISAVRGQPSAV